MHTELIHLSIGWYCPDCGEVFAEKPIVKEKITILNVEDAPVEDAPAEEKPKKKKSNSKSATAKKS